MPPSRWLFSPVVDVAAFGGSALLSFVALAIGWQFGWLDGEKADTPEWTWIVGVLLIDVAHVWSTLFRVYLDPEEFRRRPGLYSLVPVAGFVVGVGLYSLGATVFWHGLAYLAVFHFIRQQYGWVMLYRARNGESTGWWIDAATIYLATVYPLVYWHSHLPRRFWWFIPGDFERLPTLAAEILEPVYWLALAVYFLRPVKVGVHIHAGAHGLPGAPAGDGVIVEGQPDIPAEGGAFCKNRQHSVATQKELHF